jgi:UDP-N-acetyl-D-galactosamine dehydrogenase
LPKSKAVVFAVAHQAFVKEPVERIAALMKPGGVLVDVKSAVDAEAYRARGVDVWRL